MGLPDLSRQVVASQQDLQTATHGTTDRANIRGPLGVNILSYNQFLIEHWELSPVGNDVVNLTAAAVDLTVYGRGGNDRISTGRGHDKLFGGEGDDVLASGDGNDEMAGGLGADQYSGGHGNDTLKIDRADLALNNGRGFINAGLGYDKLLVEDASITRNAPGINIHGYSFYNAEFVRGSRGNDQIRFGDTYTNLLFFGWDGGDILETGYGHDILHGDEGNDFLIAGRGNDVLFGGDGNDTLRGGGDEDTCYGGRGDDTYLFRRNTILDVVVEQEGELDAVQLSPDFAGGRVAFFRDGNDLLISYKDRNPNYRGTFDLVRVKDQFVAGRDSVELFGNEGGINFVRTLAQTQGVTEAIAAVTNRVAPGTLTVFTAGEVDTITAHIASQGITAIDQVLESDTLLRYIATFG
jgi:Ca2+-binding RTX toxin-like protein